MTCTSIEFGMGRVHANDVSRYGRESVDRTSARMCSSAHADDNGMRHVRQLCSTAAFSKICVCSKFHQIRPTDRIPSNTMRANRHQSTEQPPPEECFRMSYLYASRVVSVPCCISSRRRIAAHVAVSNVMATMRLRSLPRPARLPRFRVFAERCVLLR